MSPRPTPAAAVRSALPRFAFEEYLLVTLTLLFHLLTHRGYGYFRDELYYLANAQHLGFGYVEHPPFIALVAAFVRATLGDSLFAIRLLPALAAAVTVWLTMRLAREMGGGRYARVLAGLTAAVAPGMLGLFSILSMNAFDLVFWAAAFLLVARILNGGDERLWLVFGVVCGVGLENKISVLFLGLGIAAGLLLARRWETFRTRWFWIGGALAGALFVPYVAWQAAHGWPLLEFMRNARLQKNVDLPFLAFMREQVIQMNALAVPVWVAGLAFLLFARTARPFRALGWTYPVILVVMLAAGDAKPYYLVPAYTVLFAAGGVAWERAAWRGAGAMRALVIVLVLAGGAVAAPIAKGLLSEETFVRYAAVLGVQPSSGERQALGRLPQHFADMHGWPELADTVARVYQALPPADQARACVFAQNYGDAGAIDLFGRRLGLPGAISGHNSYWLWGPGGCTGDVLIVIGDGRERLEELFSRVDLGAVFRCADCMPYENNRSIWVARGLGQPMSRLWPRIKKFI